MNTTTWNWSDVYSYLSRSMLVLWVKNFDWQTLDDPYWRSSMNLYGEGAD